MPEARSFRPCWIVCTVHIHAVLFIPSWRPHTHSAWWGGLLQPLQTSCALWPAGRGTNHSTGWFFLQCVACSFGEYVGTHSRFLLIRGHDKYVLDLHHCCNCKNLFGAAKIARVKKHLGKHGAEGKLCHPQAHGISQSPIVVQTCQ